MTLSMAAAGSSIGPRWTPLQFGSSLILWLDGKDTGTIAATSGRVTQWDDKSGKGNHATQTTASVRPSYTAGNEYVTFDVQDYRLDTPISGSTRTETALAVVRLTLGLINSTILGPSLAGGRQWRMSDVSPFSVSYLKSGVEVLHQGTTAVQTGSDAVFLSRASATEIRVGYNGNWSTGSNSVTLDGGSTTRIGARHNNNNQSLRGRIYELFVTNSTMGDDDLRLAEGYLAHRWGLTADLPSDHPYKNIRP